MTAALACLVLVGAAVVAGDSAAEERSAEEVLDEANERMHALTLVTIDVYEETWDTGDGLEQIRTGETDYVRLNRAHVERKNTHWIKTRASDTPRKEGLTDCTRDFTSFGTVTKGKPAEVDGEWAVVLKVTEADDEGSFTFYIAAEGEPYIRKVVYEGPEYHSTTEFSAFDEPLNVRPPAKADVLDMSVLGR
ncbi:LolA family protein [Streptomyces antibioticus]